MRTTLAIVAVVGLGACSASEQDRPTTWTELEGWPSREAESFRIEGVVRSTDGAEEWFVEDAEGRAWVPMSLPDEFRLPTLVVQADVRLRPDLLSLEMAGELVEVLRIRSAPGALPTGPEMVEQEEATGAAEPPDHPLWGEWRIVGHFSPGVAAMPQERAAAWTGRALEYGASAARSPNGECLDPSYRDRSASVDALLSGEFGVPATSIPLIAETDSVEVVDVRCTGASWSAVGEVVIIIDQRRALTPWDGVFFELRRTR